MLFLIFRKILIKVKDLAKNFTTGPSLFGTGRPIKMFMLQGEVAFSITREDDSEPSVRILRGVALSCQDCKCVFYLLVDSETNNGHRSKAVCPDCGSSDLYTWECL